MKRCANPACGRHFARRSNRQRFCTPACRIVGSRPAERVRYGRGHRELRKRLAPAVASGSTTCARCLEPILPGEPWDLDHDDNDPGTYLGPSHASCNRAAPNLRNQAAQNRGNGPKSPPPGAEWLESHGAYWDAEGGLWRPTATGWRRDGFRSRRW